MNRQALIPLAPLSRGDENPGHARRGSVSRPARLVAVGLFVPASIALCAHLFLYWILFAGCRWPQQHAEALGWALLAVAAVGVVLIVAGLAELLRGAFRVWRLGAVAWAVVLAVTPFWPLVAVLPAARRLGNRPAARWAAWGGAFFLLSAALGAVPCVADAPVFWPLLLSIVAGTALVLASLRTLGGDSLPHRLLARAFALVVLLSLATQPSLHAGRVRREADSAFAALVGEVGVPPEFESPHFGRPPVPEADDPVAAFDPEALKAEQSSLFELKMMLDPFGVDPRRHPYQPDELAAAAAWFASHTNLAAAADAMSAAPGYRSCLAGRTSLDEWTPDPFFDPRAMKTLETAQTIFFRARMALAAGDGAAGADAVRRMENLATVLDAEPVLLGFLLADAIRSMSFALVAERIDLWSEDDLLALQRAADDAANRFESRARFSFAGELRYVDGILADAERNVRLEESAALRSTGILAFWIAAERRALFRHLLASWSRVSPHLSAREGAVPLSGVIEDLRSDEASRRAALPRFAAMLAADVWSGIIGSVSRTRDRASFVRVAVAVERYRRANAGALPPSLDALVPDFLPAVPRSVRTGEPFAYEPGPLDIPEEAFPLLRDPDEAAAETHEDFVSRYGDVDTVPLEKLIEEFNEELNAGPDRPAPETRTLPAQTLPGFRLTFPNRYGEFDDDDVYSFFLAPASSAPATQSPDALESHAESAESESHAETAENAEPNPHAESAEGAESESHAETAETAEPNPHAESAEGAEFESHAESAESAEN